MVSSDCIEAKKYNILYRLVKESAYEEAADEIGELIATIDRIESKNAFLYYSLSSTFCRVVSGCIIFICIYLYTRVYIYVHECVYICTHVCIYVHACVHRCCIYPLSGACYMTV